ncbi:cyclic-phosphate processing receiver domain-containing protein [Paenibacillus sp. PAMC21692]|uniref:cyclic-phosphate processing receiver domain-containing protein n=1 Tax=Paenibacillus sp. PAMC21692 TaxID=2762320 RepID=UPI00164D3454|nr:cyclic-phosphate processing receiver domain-containing protein [Paenibacillus sp. PAMC21692]QNK55229.1 cell division protein FtsJ [Paenibacillus sp. PAMC21692]
MIHVYLDDYRRCPDGFVLARNAEECKQLIQYEEIDVLSLDFDLGWGQPTGDEVVRHIVSTGRFPSRIYLHTSSVSGRNSMYHTLSASLPDRTQLFGGPMPHALLDEIARNHRG